MVNGKSISELIAGWETDAAQRERQSKHGSAVSSMSEDAGEGMVAQRIREMIEELKVAKARVTPTALVGFDTLRTWSWFIFPQALERMINGTCVEEDRTLIICVKISSRHYTPLHDIAYEQRYSTFDESDVHQKVIEVYKPRFGLLG